MRTAAFVASLLLLAACQKEGRDVARSVPSGSSTTTEAAAQAAEPNAPTLASPTQQVHLMEWAIHMPDTLPAGRVAFDIENGGKEIHAFEIEGNGIEEKSNELSGGSTATLEVNLAPGTYTVYCPVKDHKSRGMKKTVTVK